jgi:dienelactone hydrolase
VLARVGYAVAALALVAALLGLRAAAREVAHYPVTLPDGVPAVVYEPGESAGFGPPAREGEPVPVVVLAHGFAANRGMMSGLARYLARGGYAVIALDFRGHGENAEPFARGFGTAGNGLLEDLDGAVLYARTEPRFDGQRVALAGHAMGGGAALTFATREPNVGAVVAISAGRHVEGPYTPGNVLLIWASGDPARLREAARATGAKLAGLEQLVLERTYGDPERGSAVRLSEVSGTDHATILWSEEAGARVLDWLRRTLGPGAPAEEPVPGDGRLPWTLLGGAAFFALFAGLVPALAPRLPRAPLPELSGPWMRLAALVGALVVGAFVLSVSDGAARRSPFGFVPLEVARDVVGYLAASGVALCAWLAWRGRLRTEGLASARTWLGAGLLWAFAYVLFGGLLLPWVDLWLSPHRVVPAAACAALSLPYFGATELLLRGAGRTGVWLPIAGKLLTLLALAAAALAGVVPFFVLFALGGLVLQFALLEGMAWRISRVAPSPWLQAALQALWVGWTLGAIFPYAP